MISINLITCISKIELQKKLRCRKWYISYGDISLAKIECGRQNNKKCKNHINADNII